MSIQRLTFLEDGCVTDDNFVIAIEVNLVSTGMFPVYITLNCAGNRIHNIGWDYNVFRKT